ncbi:MAG: hypothetical protein A3A33_03415 [Candidatus Yanofskybacteria bacterium RIFCSPLOWO2_01_FULL_49_25]|uniref:Fimbrial assembly protein n=1 Tax=Candidatus Yanofskybacteria bacterium RIFCSPLOWO2_01_FULL_49_25 TaxID=1802701 RepID=A0A1F8GTT7_9BACT|nr:MAG: hypothetical protein A3A33_03415 [Candidatus Yanofskybacteria bacterium RIFCSPLOWO2_01_FULL_49_25]
MITYQGDIKGLQLLPNHKQPPSGVRLAKVSGGYGLLIVAIVCVLALGGAYWYFFNTAQEALDNIQAIDAELVSIQKGRDKITETKLLNLQKQLTTIGALLSNHILWSGELKKVNQLIQPRVVFQSVSADVTNRTYQFAANADSYTTVARQVAAFYGSPDITDVVLSSVTSRTNGGVDFTMTLTFRPGVLSAEVQPKTKP